MTFLEAIESPLGGIWEKGEVKEGDLEDLMPEIKEHPQFKDMLNLEWGSILSRDWEDGQSEE